MVCGVDEHCIQGKGVRRSVSRTFVKGYICSKSVEYRMFRLNAVENCTIGPSINDVW